VLLSDALSVAAAGGPFIPSKALSQRFPEAALVATAQLLDRCSRARYRLGCQFGVRRLHWLALRGLAEHLRAMLAPLAGKPLAAATSRGVGSPLYRDGAWQ
jgi:hypothetical protein